MPSITPTKNKDPRLSLESLIMERVMRFELTTSTLARLRSTPELHPHRVLFGALAAGLLARAGVIYTETWL